MVTIFIDLQSHKSEIMKNANGNNGMVLIQYMLGPQTTCMNFIIRHITFILLHLLWNSWHFCCSSRVEKKKKYKTVKVPKNKGKILEVTQVHILHSQW